MTPTSRRIIDKSRIRGWKIPVNLYDTSMSPRTHTHTLTHGVSIFLARRNIESVRKSRKRVRKLLASTLDRALLTADTNEPSICTRSKNATRSSAFTLRVNTHTESRQKKRSWKKYLFIAQDSSHLTVALASDVSCGLQRTILLIRDPGRNTRLIVDRCEGCVCISPVELLQIPDPAACKILRKFRRMFGEEIFVSQR